MKSMVVVKEMFDYEKKDESLILVEKEMLMVVKHLNSLFPLMALVWLDNLLEENKHKVNRMEEVMLDDLS
jgi:hypothetical protein